MATVKRSRAKEEITVNVALSPMALHLRKLRMAKKLSQKQVAKLCGLPLETIVAFECGQKTPSDKELELITHLIG